MGKRSVRIGAAAAVAGLVVGGIAISLPTAASSAVRTPSVTSHASKYTFNVLLGGLLFDEGPVGKLTSARESSTAPTKFEALEMKSIASRVGPASTQATVATELQSGNLNEFMAGVSAIDKATSLLASTAIGQAVTSTTPTPQELAARARLTASGELGLSCSASAGPNATSCAQNPSSVSPNADTWIWAQSDTAIFVYRTSVAVIAISSNTIRKGNPNFATVQKYEEKLTGLLKAVK